MASYRIASVYKSNLPGSFFHDLPSGWEELLSRGLDVLQERLGARCKTCDAKSNTHKIMLDIDTFISTIGMK